MASREELKIEIKKYKNIALRVMKEMKDKGIKVPAGIKINEDDGSGLKEEAMPEKDGSGIPGLDDNVEENKMGDDGEQGVAELSDENERLKDHLVKLNMDMKEKNENMLNMLDEIEEIKI